MLFKKYEEKNKNMKYYIFMLLLLSRTLSCMEEPVPTPEHDLDLYRIMQVTPHVTYEELRKKYIHLHAQLQQQSFSDPAEQSHEFIKLNRAFVFLSNPEIKEIYDREGYAAADKQYQKHQERIQRAPSPASWEEKRAALKRKLPEKQRTAKKRETAPLQTPSPSYTPTYSLRQSNASVERVMEHINRQLRTLSPTTQTAQQYHADIINDIINAGYYALEKNKLLEAVEMTLLGLELPDTSKSYLNSYEGTFFRHWLQTLIEKGAPLVIDAWRQDIQKVLHEIQKSSTGRLINIHKLKRLLQEVDHMEFKIIFSILPPEQKQYYETILRHITRHNEALGAGPETQYMLQKLEEFNKKKIKNVYDIEYPKLVLKRIQSTLNNLKK